MSEHTPAVTVLMPVYNGARHLAEAIDSLLAQTFTDFHLLIIDDGSSDDSVAVARANQNPRVQLLLNEENRGLISTLNRGLDLVKSEFVARMDQDDVARPQRLERQVAFLSENPVVGVCGSWVEAFGAMPRSTWKYPSDHEAIRARLLFSSAMAHPTVMMRAAALGGLRYRPEYAHAEDYAFWAEAAGKTRLANLPDVLLDYRIHEHQVGRRHETEQQATGNRIRQMQLESLEIQATAAEIALHADIGLGRPLDRAGLERADAWLARIDEANRQAALYQPEALAAEINWQWWQACARANVDSVEAWRVYRAGCASRGRRGRLLDRARFARDRQAHQSIRKVGERHA